MSASQRKSMTSNCLEHCFALESLLARDGWAGEAWLKKFAADSRRIGEALGSLREDASEEMSEHKQRIGQGFGALSKLHSVLMCNAAAKTLADSIEAKDLIAPRGQDLSLRQKRIVLAGSRSFGEINDAEKFAFIAALDARLSERRSSGHSERMSGLARLMSETKNFTPTSRSMLISALSASVAPMDNESAEVALVTNGPAYVPSSAPPPEQLLDRNHAPNDLLWEATLYATRMFALDPSAKLEARFYGLCNLYLYDNAELSKRYPNGVFDGTVLLLPVSLVSKGFGSGMFFERAMEGLSTAARQALGFEESAEGVSRMEPGVLHEALISAGMLGPARSLTRSQAQNERALMGFDAVDVANALREACLEGLGFPTPEASQPSPQMRLDASLREAVWLGLDDRARELLREGANPKSVSAEGTSALMMAAAAGSFEWVERLASMSSPEAVDRHGRSASDYARMDPVGLGLAQWLAGCARSVIEKDELWGATGEDAKASLRDRGGARL